MINARIIVQLANPIGIIHPSLYGYFFDNCGEGIYPGVWVEPNSKIANDDGLRLDVSNALTKLGPSALRWPGGWYADLHHWRDGIGPRNARPKSLNPARWDKAKKRYGVTESNQFGFEEYMRFCRKIGSEPYLCINMITDTAREAFHWVEYSNWDGDTFYTKLREKNGSKEPHRVRFWNIGNESAASPEGYAQDFLKFANAMKRVDGKIEIIAAASGVGNDWSAWNPWNQRLMEQLKDYIQYIDHLAFHYYVDAGRVVDFSDEQYYEELAHYYVYEDLILNTLRIADFYSRGKKRLGLVIDEWGRVGSPEDRMWTVVNTFREAMLSASILNLFNKYSNRIAMANVSTMINSGHCLIYADEQGMFLTPNYYVWDMYKAHKNGTALATIEESPIIKERPLKNDLSSYTCYATAAGVSSIISDETLGKPLHALSCSASIAGDRKTLSITFLNQSLTDSMEVAIEIPGKEISKKASLQTFVSDDVRDINTYDHPTNVKAPIVKEILLNANHITITVPAHSINLLKLSL